MTKSYLISKKYPIELFELFSDEIFKTTSQALEHLGSIRYCLDKAHDVQDIIKSIRNAIKEIEYRVNSTMQVEGFTTYLLTFEYIQKRICMISDLVMRYQGVNLRSYSKAINVDYYSQGGVLRSNIVVPLWDLFYRYKVQILEPFEGKITGALYKLIENPSLYRDGDGFKLENDLNNNFSILLGEGCTPEKPNVDGRIDLFYEKYPDYSAIIECKRFIDEGKSLKSMLLTAFEQLEKRVKRPSCELFLVMYVCSDDKESMQKAIRATKDFIKVNYKIFGFELDHENSSQDHYLSCYKTLFPYQGRTNKLIPLKVYFPFLTKRKESKNKIKK
ncbi:hypothetical protein L3V32_10315 [Vibrio sp. J2-4]|uniref:hypothetical protein n=1 Tax=Vibrio sp. J2-4 TaxID=1507977 RepID=UPI001F22BFF6|nr:hypothetical protein [Vibrio sp. J2-4]MCF7477084.1 hypothetical protein [Vibrio sp. J2-4]